MIKILYLIWPEYQRYRLWTRNEWYLFREEVKKGAGNAGRRTAKVVLEDKGEHKLGVVPVFPVDCIGRANRRILARRLLMISPTLTVQ